MRQPVRNLMAWALALGLTSAWAAPTGWVYTANERDNSISEVQLDNGQVRTIKLDIAPHNVQIAADGASLLAVGMSAHAAHHGPGSQGQLLILRPAALGAGASSIAAGEHPAHVVTDANAERAFVSDSAANLVRVIDLKSSAEIGQIATDRYPHGLRLSPDGQTLYVANMKGGTVSVIDVPGLKETKRIAVGKGPVQVGFSADGKQAYVSLSGENRLGLIDTASQRLMGKVAVGRTPIQMMAPAGTREVYVANQGSAKNPADTVSVVDPAKAKVVATLKTGQGAHGVASSTDGAYVFVTNIESGTLSVIETATRKVVATHQVGAGPNGVTFLAR
ncbi:YncE family protein [Malikia spinosa]|jgi:YVTN family beta-propeller protein|uniref:YncE family protein n=1 Tax=Malikia spinosa TaxID=86180 RepID=UPI003FA1C2E4